ncbi:beta carbonic anhydrase clade D [Xylogone sp. PMI_703]|nr:beta carbonic anhydrase clade D [Xylogone sp. PMI_703]
MAAKSQIQQALIASNEKYASTFKDGHLALPPAKKYAIVTCMDARIDPAAAFGIPLGDAHVIRNAGASAVDSLRSLIISEQLLGTNEIILIKHTGCGMLTFTKEDADGLVQQRLGDKALEETRSVFNGQWLQFPDLEEAVKKDVAFLKASEAIPKDVTISGWVYEVETGKVRSVV